MNKFGLLIVAIFILLPKPVQSDSSDLYSLARIGSMLIKNNEIADIQVISVVVGLQLKFPFYVETEFNTSVAGGSYRDDVDNGTLSISNLGIYGVYRYVFNNKWYGKVKAGLSYRYLDYDNDNNMKSYRAESFSGGAGGGIGFVFHTSNQPVMLEFELAKFDKNIDYVTLGLTYPF